MLTDNDTQTVDTLTHLWANLHNTLGSPHFQALLKNDSVEHLKTEFEVLQKTDLEYQKLFGEMKLLGCQHDHSIFSPAAYLLDLMFIIEKHIKATEKSLNQRRPDLQDIKLTVENTTETTLFLTQINQILEKNTGISGSIKQHFAQKYDAKHNLIFNYPLAQIRAYLKHLDTELATIYQTVHTSEIVWAKEYLELSEEEYAWLTTDSNADTTAFDLQSVLKYLNLSLPELKQLIEQNLSEDERKKGVAKNLYINKKGLITLKNHKQGEKISTKIDGITQKTLAWAAKLTFLAQKLHWDFSDLDWILCSFKSIQQTFLDEKTTLQLAQVKQLHVQTQLQLDVLASFWHDMKTIGKGDNPKHPADLYQRVFGTDIPAQLDIKSPDIKTFNWLAASLKCTEQQLSDLLSVFPEEKPLTLDIKNLSQLFRLQKLLEISGFTFAELQLFPKIQKRNSVPTTPIKIADLVLLLDEVKQFRKMGFTVFDLDYIVYAVPHPSVEIKYSEKNISQLMTQLWQQQATSNEPEQAEPDGKDLIQRQETIVANVFGLNVELFSHLLETIVIWFKNQKQDLPEDKAELLRLLLTRVKTDENPTWKTIELFWQTVSRALLLIKKLNLHASELVAITHALKTNSNPDNVYLEIVQLYQLKHMKAVNLASNMNG